MTPFAIASTNILSVGIVIADILIVFLILIFLFQLAHSKNQIVVHISRFLSNNILLFGFIVSLAAFLGSLFYSNVIGFVPCELCWWQRLLIYPQVILFAVGLYYKKKGLSIEALLTSSLMLSSIGALIALYHAYGQLIDNSVLPACEVQGVSCAKQYFVTFGYINIPTMSLTIFLLLIVGILVRNRYSKTLNGA
jgi:disulfide bond formation protein DsbB